MKQHKWKKCLLTLAGGIGIVLFAIPLFTKRILNVGNGAGMFLFGVLLLYGIWLERINKWLSKKWKKKSGKVVLGTCSVVLFAAAVLIVLFSGFMIKAAAKKPTEDATLIVLGCKVYGEKPSLMLRERMDAAYDYLAAHPNTNCILSGGQGPEEDITEAECMYRYLVEKGTDPRQLYQEDQSTSTRENLLYSSAIIREHNWGKQVILVTNEFHEYRASEIGKKLDLEVSALSAKTAWWLFPTYYVRELFGILYEAVL